MSRRVKPVASTPISAGSFHKRNKLSARSLKDLNDAETNGPESKGKISNVEKFKVGAHSLLVGQNRHGLASGSDEEALVGQRKERRAGMLQPDVHL